MTLRFLFDVTGESLPTRRRRKGCSRNAGAACTGSADRHTELTSNKERRHGSAGGPVVIVTGASSGLGEQLARALARRARPGARRAPRGPARGAVRGHPRADAVMCDVTDEEDRRRLIETVIERHGRLDGLVNNAGAGAPRPALRTPAETFARVVDLNLWRPSVSRASRRSNAGEGQWTLDRQHRLGHGRQLDQGDPGRGLRRVQGRDHRPDARARLPVGPLRDPRQCGRPGFFASEMTAGLGDDPEQFPDFLLSRTPLGRGGRSGELDDAVLYLLGAGRAS